MSRSGSQRYFLPSGRWNDSSQQRYSNEYESYELRRQSIHQDWGNSDRFNSRSSYAENYSKTPPFQRFGGPNASNISFNESSFFTSTNFRQNIGKRNEVHDHMKNQSSKLNGSYTGRRNFSRYESYPPERERNMCARKNTSHERSSPKKVQGRGNKYGKKNRIECKSSSQERSSCSWYRSSSYSNKYSWQRNSSSEKYGANPIHAKSQSFTNHSQESLKIFDNQNEQCENGSNKHSTNLPGRKRKKCEGDNKFKERNLVHRKDSVQRKTISEKHTKSANISAESPNISHVQAPLSDDRMVERIEFTADSRESLQNFSSQTKECENSSNKYPTNIPSKEGKKAGGDNNKSKQRSLVHEGNSHECSETHSSKSHENDSLQRNTSSKKHSKSESINADSPNTSDVHSHLSNDKMSEKIEFTVDSQELLEEYDSQIGNDETSKSKYLAKDNLVFPLTHSFEPVGDHSKNTSHKPSETARREKSVILPSLKLQSNKKESSIEVEKVQPAEMNVNENDKSFINSILLYPTSVEDNFSVEEKDIDIQENSLEIDLIKRQTQKEDENNSPGKSHEKTSEDMNEMKPSIGNSNLTSASPLKQQEDSSKNSYYLSITSHENALSPSIPCAQPPSCRKPERQVDPLGDFISEMVSPSLPSPQQASVEPYQPTLYSSQKISLDADFDGGERNKNVITQNIKTINAFLDILPPSDQTFSLTLGQRNQNAIEDVVHQKADTLENPLLQIMPSCPSTPIKQNLDLCRNTSMLPNYLGSSFFENENETKDLKTETEPVEKNTTYSMPIQSLFTDQSLLAEDDLIPCTPGSSSSVIPSIHSLKSFLHSNANSKTSPNCVSNESRLGKSIFHESDSNPDFPSLLKRLSPNSIEWHESSKNPVTSTQYSQKIKHFTFPEISPLKMGVDLEFSSSAGFFARMSNLNRENDQAEKIINSIPNASMNSVLHSDVSSSSEVNNETYDASLEGIPHTVKTNQELIYDDSKPECELEKSGSLLVPNVSQNHVPHVDTRAESVYEKKVQFEDQQSSDSHFNMTSHSARRRTKLKTKRKKQNINSSIVLTKDDIPKKNKNHNYESTRNENVPNENKDHIFESTKNEDSPLKENKNHNFETKNNENLLRESKDYNFVSNLNSALEKLKHLLLKRKLHYENKGISCFELLVRENCNESSMDLASYEISGINPSKINKKTKPVVSLEVVPKAQVKKTKKHQTAKKVYSDRMDDAYFAGESWWEAFLDPLPESVGESPVKPKIEHDIIPYTLVVDSSEETTKSKKKKIKMSTKSSEVCDKRRLYVKSSTETAESCLEDSLCPKKDKKKKRKSSKFVNNSFARPEKFEEGGVENIVHSKNPIILLERDEVTEIGAKIFSHKNEVSEKNNFKSFQGLEKNIPYNHEIRGIANLGSNEVKKKSKTINPSPVTGISTPIKFASAKSTSKKSALKVKKNSITRKTKSTASKVTRKLERDSIGPNSPSEKSCDSTGFKEKKSKKKKIKKLGSQPFTPPYASQKIQSSRGKKRKLMAVTENYLEKHCIYISD